MTELEQLIQEQQAEDNSFQPRESFVTSHLDDLDNLRDPSNDWHRRVQGCAIHGLENIYVNPGTGRWQCRFCRQESNRRYYARNRRKILRYHKEVRDRGKSDRLA